MAQILIVCTANVCRSPVGEALLRDRLQKRGLAGWSVKSAGTWAQAKRGASQHSVDIMAEKGLDITKHQSEMIELAHMENSDLVLCMESGHMEALKAEFPAQVDKIFLLSEMVDRKYSINDPYGQSKNAYYRMVNDLVEIVDNGLDKIIEEAEVQASHR